MEGVQLVLITTVFVLHSYSEMVLKTKARIVMFCMVMCFHTTVHLIWLIWQDLLTRRDDCVIFS